MKKIIVLIIVSFSIFVFVLLKYVKKNNDNLIFRCEGELLVDKSISDEQKVKMHIDANYFIYKNGNGKVTLDGSIDNYHFNRMISFGYSNKSGTGAHIVVLNNSVRRHIDNTPDELSKYFFGVGNSYIISISRLTGNTYLISNSRKPIMLCLEY